MGETSDIPNLGKRQFVGVVPCTSFKILPRPRRAPIVDVRDLFVDRAADRVLSHLAESNAVFGVYSSNKVTRNFYFNRPGRKKLCHKSLVRHFTGSGDGRTLKIAWRLKVAIYDKPTGNYYMYSATETTIKRQSQPMSAAQLKYLNIKSK